MPPSKTAKKAATPKKAIAKKKAAKPAGKSVAKKAAAKKASSKKPAVAPSGKKAVAAKKPAPARKKAAAKKAAPKKASSKPKKTAVKAGASRPGVAKKAIAASKKTARSANAPKGKSGLDSSIGTNFSQEEVLRKMLIQKKDELLGETRLELAKYRGEGENRQLVETALDDGDWSVIEHTDGLNLRKLGSYRDTIRKIDESIRKIDEKTYGICEDCGEQINPERLKVLPFAICCRDCQEIREEQEAAEKEESQYL